MIRQKTPIPPNIQPMYCKNKPNIAAMPKNIIGASQILSIAFCFKSGSSMAYRLFYMRHKKCHIIYMWQIYVKKRIYNNRKR